jgi:hypothetical protein
VENSTTREALLEAIYELKFIYCSHGFRPIQSDSFLRRDVFALSIFNTLTIQSLTNKVKRQGLF